MSEHTETTEKIDDLAKNDAESVETKKEINQENAETVETKKEIDQEDTETAEKNKDVGQEDTEPSDKKKNVNKNAKRNDNGTDEEELSSRTLQIQNKRFYLDVKQNSRGRFVKISEVATRGRKTRVLMSLSTAADFRDHLADFDLALSALPPHNPQQLAPGGRIKSAAIIRDLRRYFVDLKENGRGRFLRVTMMTPMSRSQVVFPAESMAELRDEMDRIVKEFSEESVADEQAGELPESQSLRVDGKVFYFDVARNRRGVFLRISEVRANSRTAITVPERCWSQFRDIVQQMAEGMQIEGEEKQEEPLVNGNAGVKED